MIFKERILFFIKFPSTVIPANAGIHFTTSHCLSHFLIDSCFCRNDGGGEAKNNEFLTKLFWKYSRYSLLKFCEPSRIFVRNKCMYNFKINYKDFYLIDKGTNSLLPRLKIQRRIFLFPCLCAKVMVLTSP